MPSVATAAFAAATFAACLPTAAPAADHAWIVFDRNVVRTSGAEGVADRTQQRALTVDDPVRVASVSKLVVALGVMRLVEAGRLDLDEDVSTKLGWRLRNPAHPDAPITMRLLLSHRSSLKDDVDYIVPLGRDLRDALADPVAFDVTRPPGTYFRYANLNFPVIASVMERATGERFDRLIDRLVLAPLGLDACFGWASCRADTVTRGVALYEQDGSVRRDDLAFRRAPCPVASLTPACDLAAYVPGANGALFSPQGGLRISARDLAKVGQLLLHRGRHRGERFLTRASMATITRPAWRFDGGNGDTLNGFFCSYGLATQQLPVRAAGCSDDLFGDGRHVVGHAGEAYGLLSGLWVDERRGVGIVYFAINNPAEPPKGRSAFRAVEERLAAKLTD